MPGRNERIITVILKSFFTQMMNGSFELLFRSFSLSSIRSVYKNKITDLIEIEKNLRYMQLLDEAKIIRSGLSYKEFHDIEKATIVRGVLNHSNGNARIAACMVVDYDLLNDIDILNLLENRLLNSGIGGIAVWQTIKEYTIFGTGDLVTEDKVTSYDKSLTENDENMVLN
jgi:hypothetical protein